MEDGYFAIFQPSWSTPSGLIGEDPIGVPNNLMPYVMKVAGETYQGFYLWCQF